MMSSDDIILYFKEAFEEEIKKVTGEDLEINVNKCRVVDVQYFPDDDEIMVVYLLSTRPRRKEREEIIF